MPTGVSCPVGIVNIVFLILYRALYIQFCLGIILILLYDGLFYNVNVNSIRINLFVLWTNARFLILVGLRSTRCVPVFRLLCRGRRVLSAANDKLGSYAFVIQLSHGLL